MATAKCFSDKLKMTTLLTGSTGFVGSAIARQCQAVNLPIRQTDRSSQPSQPNYTQADILAPSSLTPIMEGVECVIHAAGLAHQFGKKQSAVPFTEVNVIGTENIAQAAASAKVQHFILISSVSVYGNEGMSSCTEETICKPHGPYAQSKYQAEQRALAIAQEAGMRLTILRLATVYGEGDPGNVVRLIRAIDQKRFLWLGEGKNRKSLIHRDDVARACIAVLQSSGTGISTYNLSSPPCTMREIVETIADSLKKPVPQWQIPASPLLLMTNLASRLIGKDSFAGKLHATMQKWVNDDVYDASAFQRAFNFQPHVSLNDGLQREVAWYNTTKRK